MKLLVLGAGAWGTALAATAARRHETTLWARDATQASALQTQRRNERYLPGVDLPVALRIATGDPVSLARHLRCLLGIPGPQQHLMPQGRCHGQGRAPGPGAEEGKFHRISKTRANALLS